MKALSHLLHFLKDSEKVEPQHTCQIRLTPVPTQQFSNQSRVFRHILQTLRESTSRHRDKHFRRKQCFMRLRTNIYSRCQSEQSKLEIGQIRNLQTEKFSYPLAPSQSLPIPMCSAPITCLRQSKWSERHRIKIKISVERNIKKMMQYTVCILYKFFFFFFPPTMKPYYQYLEGISELITIPKTFLRRSWTLKLILSCFHTEHLAIKH